MNLKETIHCFKNCFTNNVVLKFQITLPILFCVSVFAGSVKKMFLL
ncbi:hypothetical protein LSS_23065 [Leptospira santarosai serovar Shermani str. LT 821]|uniref:Uncharacterized protein n=1 Tax=Leptospira santarosai serovar Shermani str. LT 821 TaxID=758847 RepID=A0A097ESZ8_9LEPT|nr:hypothetical protein LSS_23065 [Leptospira santarosai serovar Shermani str. LT 821]